MLAALCACDHGAIDSGLPEGKPAEALTPAEAQQLCAAARVYYERVVSDAELLTYVCTSRALAEAGGEQAVCEEQLSTCVDAPPPEVEAIVADVRADGVCDPLVLGGCEATVGEVEACLAEFVERIDALYAGHTCALLDPEAEDEDAAPAKGKACSAIAGRCPGIAE